MAFSTINKSTDYFTPKTLTSNAGSNMVVTGVGFQPDMVWLKSRDQALAWKQYDAVRGIQKRVRSDTNSAEATISGGLLSYDTDGFTHGTDTDINNTSTNPMSWNWKAGTTSGLSGGTITPSSYSINATSGIGIYKYTNNTVAGATIAHGLNSAPKMVIIKLTSHTGNWITGHAGMDSTFDYYLKLNENFAKANTDSMFNDTAPSSTLITLGNNSETNYSISSGSYSYIMYAFSEVAGYSKFGSYRGNGNADGTFVYTGFRPAFVIQKRIDTTGNWVITDTGRSPDNESHETLYPNLTNAEAGMGKDLLSNGFKCKTSDATINASGGTYIYMAFGQPIISNGGVCATAR